MFYILILITGVVIDFPMDRFKVSFQVAFFICFMFTLVTKIDFPMYTFNVSFQVAFLICFMFTFITGYSYRLSYVNIQHVSSSRILYLLYVHIEYMSSNILSHG